MDRISRSWRTLDARMRQYYRFLLNDVPQELVQVLTRRLEQDQPPGDEPKIDRIRPGGTPHVRMPQQMKAPPGGEPSG
jgi:hypothetical protein